MPPGPTPASGNPTAIEFSGRTAPSASGRCGMGLPNAPTAYTDVCRRWRVPVRHSGRFSGVAAAADLDRAAKECRNLLGADATKSARPSSIIQINRNLLETKLDRLVAEKVTEPLNAMPGASDRRDRQRRQIRARRGAEGVPRRPLRPEPDRQGRQARPEGAQAQGRGLRIRGHRAPQTARGKRRPAAISTGPGSMTNSRKRTDHRAMDGHGPKCTSFRALPRRSQLYRGY